MQAGIAESDARVAAGPVGAGASAATADIVGFSRSEGLFAGVAFDGSVVNPSKDKNAAYHSKDVSPADVLILETAVDRYL